jgi:hypothetical protein
MRPKCLARRDGKVDRRRASTPAMLRLSEGGRSRAPSTVEVSQSHLTNDLGFSVTAFVNEHMR